jgi:hypothetical protein
VVLISSTGGPYRRQDAAGRCPVCGEKNATCGGPTNHVPIDIPTQPRQEDGVSGPLRIYKVDVAGRRVLFRLNQTDAQRLGGTPAPGTDADAASTSDQPTGEKSRQPPNKARTPPNKSSGNPQQGNG